MEKHNICGRDLPQQRETEDGTKCGGDSNQETSQLPRCLNGIFPPSSLDDGSTIDSGDKSVFPMKLEHINSKIRGKLPQIADYSHSSKDPERQPNPFGTLKAHHGLLNKDVIEDHAMVAIQVNINQGRDNSKTKTHKKGKQEEKDEKSFFANSVLDGLMAQDIGRPGWIKCCDNWGFSESRTD